MYVSFFPLTLFTLFILGMINLVRKTVKMILNATRFQTFKVKTLVEMKPTTSKVYIDDHTPDRPQIPFYYTTRKSRSAADILSTCSQKDDYYRKDHNYWQLFAYLLNGISVGVHIGN